MTFPWYYAMAAKGIQNFILQGDKLRLMVGGSELIEGLPNDFAGDLLLQMGLTEDVDYQVLSRAAGGARLLFKDEAAARRLVLLMPLAVSMYVPGVDVVQDLQEVTQSLAATMDVAEKRLQARRNILFPTYPVAGPLVDRAPRSGLPAAGRIHRGDESEPADVSMLARAGAVRQNRNGLLQKVAGPEAANLKIQENLEDLLAQEGEYLAVLHADANGLGQVLMALLNELKTQDNERVRTIYTQFSRAIEQATVSALQEAVRPLVQRALTREGPDKASLPFRPLICAGDDVTLILRAPDALAVAETFLKQFKDCAAAELARVDAQALQGVSLTAAAGIAFVHRNFPFSQAYQLCESLCKYAKNVTGRKASALAFWRVTATVADDFEAILGRELTPTRDVCLTMMPYQVDDADDIPHLDNLKQLMQALKDPQMPRGSVRELLSRIYESATAANQAWQRIAEVARSGRHREAFLRFETALQTLTANQPEPLWRQQPDRRATPLHDAVELLAVMGKKFRNDE